MTQDEFFSLPCPISISLVPLDANRPLPDEQAFLEEIPPLFRVASECVHLEEQAERSLNRFGSDDAAAIGQYLSAQNRKINLLLSHVLNQEADTASRFTTETFGAGHFTLLHSGENTDPWQLGARFITHLYLESPAAAVYCYSEVVNLETTADNLQRVKLRYVRIQEGDRDLLIRCTLAEQQKMLRKRAEGRLSGSE
uniref:hypothetical protein n=1 Tax=Thaumasiovibrio occultus TaxID=1891184 RepID=UPI000B34CBED|nr:hypothetical protein [Thaumasiovibrio occultus]